MIVRLVQALAHVVLVAALIVFALALALAVLGWRMTMWPYRATRLGPPGKLEAGLGLVNAAGALLAALAPQQVEPSVSDATR